MPLSIPKIMQLMDIHNTIIVLIIVSIITVSYKEAIVYIRNMKVKSRISHIKVLRNNKTNHHIINKISPVNIQKSEVKNKSINFMQKAIDKLRMNYALEDTSTKMILHRAGYRRKHEIIIFIFIKTIMPFLAIGISFIVSVLWLYQPGDSIIKYVWFILLAAAIGYYVPDYVIRSKIFKRQQQIISVLPEILGLVTICVESGMGIEQAMNRVVTETTELGGHDDAHHEINVELSILMAELSILGDRPTAYKNFATRTNTPQTKAMATAIIQSERYGTSLGEALRVMSTESRQVYINTLEEAAMSMSSKMLLPLLLFFLPVLLVILIAPSFITKGV